MKFGIKFLSCVYLVLSVGAVSWAQKPELIVQTGHSDGVQSVTFSADGKVLASCSYDNTVKLWEVASGRELRTLTGHNGWVNSVAFSPEGQIMASAGTSEIKLWEVATGRELRTITQRWANSVAFSPDGRMLASGSGDRTIKLWQVATGREVRTLTGHSSWINSIAFSPDGKTLASGAFDGTIRLWEVSTGRELRTLTGHTESVTSVDFSGSGRMLASGSFDKTIKLWEVETGRELRTLAGHSAAVNSAAFCADGKTLASGSSDKTIKVWEVATGRELRMLTGHSGSVNSVSFTADGKTLASGSEDHRSVEYGEDGKMLASDRLDNAIRLWEVATGGELRTLTGHSQSGYAVAYSADGKMLASGSGSQTIKLWDLATGRVLHTLVGHLYWVGSVAFSADGKTLASGSADHTIKLWDVDAGRELRTLTGHSVFVNSVAFSADGKTLASGSFDKTIKLWDVATGRELRTLPGHSGTVNSIALSPDGKILASGGFEEGEETIKIWELATGRELRSLTAHFEVNSVAFSADGKTLASGSVDKTAKLWEVATGRELRTLTGHSQSVNSVTFCVNGKILASGSWDNTIKLWEVETGRELRTLAGHSAAVNSVAFSGDGKFLASSSKDATTKLWRVDGGELLASLIALDETDWAVVAPDGRFDASPNAQKLMHWMVGSEPIELEQLKHRYYEPGLLAKLMGFNKEPMRDVSALGEVKLFPDVEYQLASAGSTKLNIKLTNRGGGIGEVQVFVNDKELIADARPRGFNPNQVQAVLTVDISGAAAIPGQDNEIRVVARNQEGYLSSRGTKLAWSPNGTADFTPPDLYAIVVGTSTYASPGLDLLYAAKDAGDMAKALELGAKRLFGAERVHLQLLSTDKNNPGAIAPTKANIRKAFEQVRKAKPQDIFVVYFAGHGVTLPQGSDTYLYLTQEARNADGATLADPGVREQTTISSEELVEWIKLVPTLKQVMMLDTCAAGAAAGKLVEQRNVSGDQIRALDRLKDRTGFHVLMGSAADAVSYEASQYGQGVLTYALLQGLRGAALREDEYVDVQKLFQYAADEVPQLAQNIGGLQRPVVAAPRGTSFDVGRIGREEKALIPLTMIKPVILRPVLLNAEEQADTLDLIKELRKRLRDESAVLVRSGEHQLLVVYVDEDELPGAIRPSGTYTVEGERVQVTMVLRRDNQRIATLPLVEGTKNDVAGLIDKIMKTISAAIAGLRP